MSLSSSDNDQTSPPTTPDPNKLIFPLAHPPPKTHPFRLTPKLLLQIQHLSLTSSTNRPIPVLEVWQPSRFTRRPAPRLQKLNKRDMYITQSEFYAAAATDQTDMVAAAEAGIVGVIYRGKKAQTQAQAEVCFPGHGGVWLASASASGYRFQRNDDDQVLEWERRTGTSSTASGDDGVEFVLRLVHPNLNPRMQRVRIASLTKKGFRVGRWDRIPLDILRGCLAGASSTDAQTDAQLKTAVCTLILTLGVWVASQEHWLD